MLSDCSGTIFGVILQHITGDSNTHTVRSTEAAVTAGLFETVGEAIVGTWQQDVLKGFFHCTGVTLCQEVPLYVAGMGLYAESMKIFSIFCKLVNNCPVPMSF